MAKSPAWTRVEGQSKSGGLNAKGRASAKAQGMNLKPPPRLSRRPTRTQGAVSHSVPECLV